jgi:hypothetical protein
MTVQHEALASRRSVSGVDRGPRTLWLTPYQFVACTRYLPSRCNFQQGLPEPCLQVRAVMEAEQKQMPIKFICRNH